MTFPRKMMLFFVSVGLISMISTRQSYGDEKNTKQKMEETGHDIKRGADKAVRNGKDEVCELVNGKMTCMAKKAKHSMQNAGDKIEDAVD